MVRFLIAILIAFNVTMANAQTGVETGPGTLNLSPDNNSSTAHTLGGPSNPEGFKNPSSMDGKSTSGGVDQSDQKATPGASRTENEQGPGVKGGTGTSN
jgi:hypothetical protein